MDINVPVGKYDLPQQGVVKKTAVEFGETVKEGVVGLGLYVTEVARKGGLITSEQQILLSSLDPVVDGMMTINVALHGAEGANPADVSSILDSVGTLVQRAIPEVRLTT